MLSVCARGSIAASTAFGLEADRQLPASPAAEQAAMS